MDNNHKWRFPPSNHGDRKGISTGDDEAFKKAPYKSFAREILQNSIDVPLDTNKPVRVEITEFELTTNEIPDLEGYKTAISNIIDFWQHKPDYVKKYSSLLESLNQEHITCLKVSDYNTTGLTGIYSEEQKNNKWLALTQGAGVSEKSETVSGGSKGIGKNAAFELSELKMVFYYTMTSDGQSGMMGVTKQISGYVEGDTSEKRDHTQGTGYYVLDDYNTPINNSLQFSSINTGRVESGTDIYIIGFEKEDNWEKEAINSILDSFMAAIVREQLEVKLNETVIDSDSVKDLVDSDWIYDNNKANLMSQYKLLSGGDDIQVFDIETEYGTPKLYVWVVPKEQEDLATHECVMVRHPLMKIRTYPLNKSFNVSAMCIIENDNLGAQLLKIENPQHVDWETGRIKDKALRTAMISTIRSIRTQITDIVTECLKLDDDEPIDPYGASEFLPEDLGGEMPGSVDKKQQHKVTERITVSKRKDASYQEKKTIHDEGATQTGLIPDVGDVSENEEGDVLHPDGQNENQGGAIRPGSERSDEKLGDGIVYKRSVIYGAKYKWIALNKNAGLYRIKFVSPGDYDNCYLVISLVDDANNKTDVDILSLKKDGAEINGENKNEYGPFSIKTNEKVELDVVVNENEYFSSEVKIVCK